MESSPCSRKTWQILTTVWRWLQSWSKLKLFGEQLLILLSPALSVDICPWTLDDWGNMCQWWSQWWSEWWSESIMMMTRKNWKAQGELSVSCQSANICKGHDQGQTAPYTSSTMITIRATTSRNELVSYYCFLLLLWWCEMLLWGSLWWCWLAVVIEVPAIVHLIFVPDQYWLLIFCGYSLSRVVFA